MRESPLTIITARGIGKPDYTREISRAIERPGISLKFNQALKLNALVCTVAFSPYSWVRVPLAIGETAHVIDMATGLALPYTVPVGWTYEVIQRFINFDEDVMNRAYIDALGPLGFLVFEDHIGGGNPYTRKDILGLGTSALDPTGATTHQVDNTYTNLGLGVASGSAFDIILMEAVGTPPAPTTKTVRCKWCGYLQEDVPVDTDRLVCPACGRLTLYLLTDRIRRSA